VSDQIKTNGVYESMVPPMSDTDYEKLKQSIRDVGQREPIVVNQNNVVLDGHHRLRACKELGIAPKIMVRVFANKNEETRYVIEANLIRRQLNDFQKTQLALRLKPVYEEIAKANERNGRSVKIDKPFDTRKKIAEVAGVSTGNVFKVERVLENANPDIIDKCREGTLSIHRADLMIKKAEKKRKFMEQPSPINLPDGVQLMLGDFRQVCEQIPDNSIDLIFTDPPYALDYLPLYKDLGVLAKRVLKEGGSLVTYLGQYAMPTIANSLSETGLTYWWTLGLLHNGPTTMVHGRNVFCGWKPLLWYVKGEKINTSEYLWDFIHSSKTPDKHLHEWAQSVKEADHVIRRLTYEGGVVLDPFMGSGTTGEACLNLKRKFIGVEIDKERYDIGKKRLSLATVKAQVE
jgi:16S rRNA G966 N2-methylase RsmD